MTPKEPERISIETVFDTIMILLNLSSEYDRKNGIPEGTYRAVKAELTDLVSNAYVNGFSNCEGMAIQFMTEEQRKRFQSVLRPGEKGEPK